MRIKSKGSPTLLSLNGGSSSVKFALFEHKKSLVKILSGGIEKIGGSGAHFFVSGLNQKALISETLSAADSKAAIDFLFSWFELNLSKVNLTAIGHRMVTGGLKYHAPQLITGEMIANLQELIPFDPLHLPTEIYLIEKCKKTFSKIQQYVCFDTAFHHNLPRVAKLLPIPRRFEKEGIMKYGFHGLSYEFLMEALTEQAGPEESKGRVILAHLGSGASLAAVKNGGPIDTSMSFTPTGGIPMGTRSGDLDPGIIRYLTISENLGAEKVNELLNLKSGLLGISETSSDLRELLAIENNDIRASEAIALFCYQVKKWIGGYAAILGGIDTLVFSGGIGENSAIIRSRICEGLNFLNIEIDPSKNASNKFLISTPASLTKVRVIRTDEELAIANTVCRIIGLSLITYS